MLGKGYIAINRPLKTILVRAQKKERAVEKASIVLKNTEVILKRMSVVIWMVNAILMRYQMEVRNNLSYSGGKAILANKVAKSLAELHSCPSVLWKVELVSNEIRHMAEAISKQSVEGEAWFLMTAHNKMQGREK